MNAWILGAKGNLGQALMRALVGRGHRVAGVDRGDFDARDEAELERRLREGGYVVVINTVAFNDVDGAEDPTNHQLAEALNVVLPATCFVCEASAFFLGHGSLHAHLCRRNEMALATDTSCSSAGLGRIPPSIIPIG